MNSININLHPLLAFLLGATLFGFLNVAYAWTAPTQSPPNGNVSAPVNVGVIDQIKSAGLGVNSLAVYGNAILNGTSRYLNFGTTAGSGGYGIRDNAGVIEMKNSGGAWENRNTITGNLTVSGNVTAAGYFHSSDARLKQNIQTVSGLSIIERLRGVSYEWKESGESSAGVIAQEVETILPHAVHTDTNGMKSVEYDQLVAYLIQAVKEQQSEIKELQNAIAALHDD